MERRGWSETRPPCGHASHAAVGRVIGDSQTGTAQCLAAALENLRRATMQLDQMDGSTTPLLVESARALRPEV